MDLYITSCHSFKLYRFNACFQEAKDSKVLACQIFATYAGTGIAVLTSAYRIFLITNIDEPRIRRLAEVPGRAVFSNNYMIFTPYFEAHSSYKPLVLLAM